MGSTRGPGRVRAHNKDKELDINDKLKYEVKKLKRDLKAARKMLDRYLVAEKTGLFDGEKVIPSKKRGEEKGIYEQWKCFSCETGTLELVIFGRFYLRKCGNCGKMTKRQDLNEKVNGVLSNGSIYKEQK